MEFVVSHRRLFTVLTVGPSGAFVVFVLVAPSQVVRQVTLRVLGLTTAGALAVVARAVYIVWRRASQNQPSA
ncbi:hypothetical protein ACWEPC_46580 [Nonomuraea sp. NPDC004297]